MEGRSFQPRLDQSVCKDAGKQAAARTGLWAAEGLVVKRYTPDNAAAMERSDEQVCADRLPSAHKCCVHAIKHNQFGFQQCATVHHVCDRAMFLSITVNMMCRLISAAAARLQWNVTCLAHFFSVDAQRHAADAAASAANAAGATQRALARVRAAVDRADIDATLAAASLSSSGAASTAKHSAEGFDHQPNARGSAHNDALRLFGGGDSEAKYADATWQAHAGVDRTLDVEFRLSIEVRRHALLVLGYTHELDVVRWTCSATDPEFFA